VRNPVAGQKQTDKPPDRQLELLCFQKISFVFQNVLHVSALTLAIIMDKHRSIKEIRALYIKTSIIKKE